MKKKIGIICIIITSIIFISIVIVVVLKTVKNMNTDLFTGLISSLLASFIFSFIGLIFTTGVTNQVSKLFKRKYNYNKTMKDEYIRLSYSYLIRIRVNNKYLLINSNRIKNIYQPIGGVFHIIDDSYIKTKLGFYRDGSPGDPDDIRGVIKGKYLRKFNRWFNKKKEIETAPFREFKEELLETGLLDVNIFTDDKLKFVYRCTKYEGVKENIFYGQYANYELLRFEIYEFCPNKEQLDYLKNLKDRKVFFATSSEIKTLGVDKDNNTRRFGTQTIKILEDD